MKTGYMPADFARPSILNEQRLLHTDFIGIFRLNTGGEARLMSGLGGAHVALLEGRMSGELAELVRRHGGEPYAAPAVREAALDCAEQVASFIAELERGRMEIVIFSTGSGVTTLFQE